MPRYRIAMTPNARAELRRRVAWWREHRPENPDLLEQEMAEAGGLLAGSPNMGTEHVQAGVRGVRKVILPRNQNVVYYRVDESQRVVRIVAVWYAGRAKGPPLR